jgi:hypothetical protein
LRQWEAENASTYVPPELDDSPKLGEVYNILTRPAEGEFRADHNVDGEHEGLHETLFDQSDLLDVGSRREFLRPGDLVELR